MVKQQKATDKICCEVLEKMQISWMRIEDGKYKGKRCMPHINGQDGNRYRVNYCPSCGKDVRDLVI